jgi:tRNA threonylcarbamoyladenosine biosynthesis protein TsaE
MQQKITINNLSELPAVAKQLIDSFKEQKIIAFYGAMGAGKTTLIKAICEAMGVKDVISSPTFSIVNEYRSPIGEKIYHFDFYRINTESEAYDMGYEDYFYSNAFCFVEWPEKIESLLPEKHLKLNIVANGTKRDIIFS